MLSLDPEGDRVVQALSSVSHWEEQADVLSAVVIPHYYNNIPMRRRGGVERRGHANCAAGVAIFRERKRNCMMRRPLEAAACIEGAQDA